MSKPTFRGDVSDVNDILAYEDAVRAWEHSEELRKAELSMAPDDVLEPLAGLFDDNRLPMLAGGMEGPEGREGPRGPGGPPGADGAGNLDEMLVTNAGDVVVSEAGFIVAEGGTAV